MTQHWLSVFIQAFTVTYTQAEHRIGTKIRRMKIRHNKVRNQNNTSITLLFECYQVLFHYLLLLLFQFRHRCSAALALKQNGSVHCLYKVFPWGLLNFLFLWKIKKLILYEKCYLTFMTIWLMKVYCSFNSSVSVITETIKMDKNFPSWSIITLTEKTIYEKISKLL